MRENAYTRAAEPRLARDRIPGTVENHTGGAVFDIGDMAAARRFLLIGTTGGTYYQSERDITRENVDILRKLAVTEPEALVELIADVSERGLAPKLDPGIFAFALCTSMEGPVRALAYAEFGRVIRTGSHLLMWDRYRRALGGKIGRAYRRAVSQWYLARDADALAYQLAKYRQRDGRRQKDLIDVSHVLAQTSRRDIMAALNWSRDRAENIVHSDLPALLRELDNGEATAESLIRAGASWEMLPDAMLRDKSTWEYLLANRRLPLGAMIRQLARMTELGVFDVYASNPSAKAVIATLTDERALQGARIHPLNLVLAQRQYRSGQSRSGLQYVANSDIVDAMDDAFYASFYTAPASNKRTLVGVDISSSMTMRTPIGLTSHEIATVLAMKILRTEPDSHVMGFASSIRELGMTRKMTLPQALATTQGAFGSTNPSALMAYASQHKIPVDTFVVITDNEVNSGRHVPDVLRAYRSASGINAKLVVIATTATRFSIADPQDPGMLDIAGFGADVPALLTEFSRGA